ncbi:MAG: family 78 glycoside hydrolase catalytic domain [Acidimicrobiales bacterium]
MVKVDRRSFMVNGLRAGAVVAAVGSVAYDEWSVTQPAATPAAAKTPGSPVELTTNGDTFPVGVDPDDVSFAWKIYDPTRGARQTGYRVRLTLLSASPDATPVWESGSVISGRQAFVAYTGPALEPDTRYGFTVSTRNAHGAWSAESGPGSFITGLRDSDWNAEWLRPGPADTGLEKYTYLRRQFTLPEGAVDHAIVYTAAAHKYQLWLNASLIDTGTSFCFPDEQYYQATDVTAHVRSGPENVLGFLHHWYGGGKARPTSVPGLLAHLSVVYADGRHVVVGTDGTWRQRLAEWLPAPQRNNDGGDFVEIIDGRLSPIGWAGAGYDDNAWEQAVVMGPVGTVPFTRMFAQRTRITELPIEPVSVTTLEDASVVIDFGKIYAARPVVEFHHGISGRTVSMHVGYVLDPDGHVSTTHATQQTNLAFYYTQRDGSQKFDPYTFLGFRYLEIDGAGEPIGSDQVTAMARHCKMPDNPNATFTSSDKILDSVWDMCARSGLYVTHEEFVDTPTREKGQFLWDSCSESQVILRSIGESNLSFQALRDFSRSQKRFWSDGRVSDIYPTAYGPQSYVSFTALYPEWVWRYYASTGDTKTMQLLHPTLEKLSDYLYEAVVPSTGLVTGRPLYPSADSNYAYDFNTNADTSINIGSANGLARIGDVADVVGDTSGALVHRQRSETVAAAINKYLRRPNGLYADGLRSDGTLSPHSSQLVNLQALAYGFVPDPDRRFVGEYVASLGISVEPDEGMNLLRALHYAGLDGEVVETLTNASRPGWAWILAHGGTFCWEAWVLSDLIGDSMSHGWGSSALVAMQEVLLGCVPAMPSIGEPVTALDITPAFSVLQRASGAIPTVAGTASVAWTQSSSAITLALMLPANSSATLHLPASSSSAVSVDSGPVHTADGISVIGAGGGEVTLAVGAGTYQFDVKKS